MQRCAQFSGTIPTANERREIRGAGALRCFQVSPRLAGGSPGADVCKHSQAPVPAWGRRVATHPPLLCLAFLAGGIWAVCS